MQKIEFETTLGVVPLWGRFATFARERPLLLVIRGILGQADQLVSLPDRLPEADVALAHLPGMHTPRLTQSSAPRLASAFDEIVAQLDRPAVLLGISMGGTVALGVRAPLVERMIVLDPPLETASLRPMAAELRTFASKSPEDDAWVRDLTGVVASGEIALNFRPMIDGLVTPCLALIGSETGGGDQLPSFVSPDDRGLLESHPYITTRVVQGVGHNIPRDGLGAMMWALRRALGIDRG